MAITGTGLGNIHFFAEAYLPFRFPLFHDTPFKGNSGFLLLLGDVGIIGISMLALLTIGLIRSIHRRVDVRDPDMSGKYAVIVHFASIAFVLFLLRSFELFYLTLGLLLYLQNDSRLRTHRYFAEL